MTGIAFDTLAYANKLKEAGFTDRQAQAQAEALVAVVDSNLATKADLKELEMATKADLKELEMATKRDLKELETRLEARLAELKANVKELEIATRRDLKELELRLEARIADSKAEIIKWCVGSVFASVGLFAALVRLMG